MALLACVPREETLQHRPLEPSSVERRCSLLRAGGEALEEKSTMSSSQPLAGTSSDGSAACRDRGRSQRSPG